MDKIPMPYFMSDDELKSKSTGRLLNIYRKVINQTKFCWSIELCCEKCGQRPYLDDAENIELLNALEIWKSYQARIKSILDTRKDIVKPRGSKRNKRNNAKVNKR